MLIVCPCDYCHCIRLFHIAAQLGKNLVPRHADANGHAQLTFNPFADLLCYFSTASEYMLAAGDIKPCFIKSKRFYLIRILSE